MKNKKGFTLIELLVVVAIMGLLTALAVIALNTARARARDARRVSDVKQIQTALELYYLDMSLYPNEAGAVLVGTNAGNGIDIDSLCIFNVALGIATPCAGTTTYMAEIPANPAPKDEGGGTCANVGYLYAETDSRESYVLEYCLGTATGDLAAGFQCANPAGMEDATGGACD